VICRVVNLLQEKMQVKVRDKPEKKKVFPKCPCYKVGNMLTLLVFDKREPPKEYFGGVKTIISYKS